MSKLFATTDIRRRHKLVAAIMITICVAAPNAVRGQRAASRATAADGVDVESSRIPLAVDGYCVVTLRDRKKWQEGDSRIRAVFDGREYRFAGTRERAIFLAAQETYAPALGGDCPVTFAELSERVAGRLQLSVIHRGRLFFFADEECLQEFMEAPKRFVDADLALDGRCPVSKWTEHKDVAGIPETAAIRGGLRYYFASAYHRVQFLNDPEEFVMGAPASKSSSLFALTPQSAANGRPAPIGQQLNAQIDNTDKREQLALDAQPAMGGYCPVTIRQSGIWIRGRYDYRVELGDLVFLTAGSSEHDAMVSDPERFVPVLSGDCAVSMVDEDRRIRGSIFHAVEYHDRLYLFADAQHKAAFKTDPDKYENVDLAGDGWCVVTHAEEQKRVLGLPEFSAWHAGQMYRFAGPEQKAKFLGDPVRYAVEEPLQGSTQAPVVDGRAATGNAELAPPASLP